MKIHLIRSGELSRSQFQTIVDNLSKFIRPIEFLSHSNAREEDENEEADEILETKNILKTLTWSELFGICETFRSASDIKEDEVVVLLTEHPNEQNWFSAWEESGKRNFFIQTSKWNDFIEGDFCYPVIYELACIPLYLASCRDQSELKKLAHEDPRGCPFDYCKDKIQVRLKLRTGDLCAECLDRLEKKHINPAIAKQVFRIFDDIRSKLLFKERFKLEIQPSMVTVDLNTNTIHFDQLGVHVNLTPNQMTVYYYFLIHNDGIKFSDLRKTGIRTELLNIYRPLTHIARDSNAFNCPIENTQSIVNQISQITSKIHEKIDYVLGKDMADYYQINGENGQIHRIKFDRKLMTIRERP